MPFDQVMIIKGGRVLAFTNWYKVLADTIEHKRLDVRCWHAGDTAGHAPWTRDTQGIGLRPARIGAYAILPRAVRMGLKVLLRKRVPRYTMTGDGLPGDPVNLALMGNLGQMLSTPSPVEVPFSALRD
jgi:hypothetical protein